MITLQNLTTAPATATKAATGAAGAPAAPADVQTDLPGFAALLEDQLVLAAGADTTPAESRWENDSDASSAGSAIEAAAPQVEAALSMAASLPATPPGIDVPVPGPAPDTAPAIAPATASAITASITPSITPSSAPGTRIVQDRAPAAALAPDRPEASRVVSGDPPSPTISQPPSVHSEAAAFAPAPPEDSRAPAWNVNALTQPAAPHPAATAPAQANTPVVEAPVGSARWGEQLATQVVVLVRDGTHTAHIQLTPPELGPLRAQISIEDGVASVVLSASIHETREALDAALPALRDALAESGIALGETSVSDKRLGHQSEPQVGRARGEPAPPGQPAQPPARRLSAGLLDVYA